MVEPMPQPHALAAAPPASRRIRRRSFQYDQIPWRINWGIITFSSAVSSGSR